MTLKYSDHLYLLAFIDITDRYDILLLEIRHLQKIIIDSLHAPTLFLPLREEEKFLFGGWVEDDECCRLLEDEKNYTKYAKVAAICVSRYPSPSAAVKHISTLSTYDLEDDDLETSEKLTRFIGHLWSGDLWAGGERRHYHALRALQILKQQIIQDKLIFLTEAKHAEIVKLKNSRATRCKASLMILRCGVFEKINSYIRILRTHQQQFGKSLDFGLQSYPRPGIERRRDIGIYNDFLSNRTHDLHKDMLHFLNMFLDPADPKDLSERVKPMILHGWSQSTKVSGSELLDDVNLALIDNDEKETGNNDRAPQHVSYIDTSFWSPDRPDLQPLVAKHIAISLAKNYLGGINDNFLSNNEDPFADLLVSLHKIVNKFTADTPELPSLKEHYVALINDELAVDFLAASVKGIAYLYALFLSILGKGLEDQLQTLDKSIKLEMLDDLTGAVRSYESHFIWYFRLRITAYFLEKITQDRCSASDTLILEGTREVCDDILDFLDKNVPSSTTGIPVGSLWKKLAEEMEACIKKHEFAPIAKRWRLKRSDDTWCEKYNTSGDKVYHRSTIRLDLRLQRFLFRGTLQQKLDSKQKPLHLLNKSLNLLGNDSYKKDLRHQLYGEFRDIYGLEIETIPVPGNIKTEYSLPRWLFRQLHHIPYQCAVMRSIDLLGSHQQKEKTRFSLSWRRPKKITTKKFRPALHGWKKFITEIHTDMSLGREKFSMGLEFYTWARESPRERLALSNNLIVFILPQLDNRLEVKRYLIEWLQGDTGHTAEIIYDTIKCQSNGRLKKYYSPILNKIGAENIHRAFSWIQNGSCSEVRRLDQLAGYKLKALLTIYYKYVEAPCLEDEKNKESLNVLLALGAFLKIRADEGKEKFYDLVLQAFSNSVPTSALPERIPPVMLSRAVLTNAYAIADPFANFDRPQSTDEGGDEKEEAHKEGGNKTIYNAATLKYGMTRGNWSITTDNGELSKFSVILGRYDVVGITPARMPCKCRVLNFDSSFDEKETFVNHFTRREVALPVNISNKVTDKSKTTLFGIISISLQRRAMRLNLLYRVLSALDKESNKEIFPKVESSIRKMVDRHSNSLNIQGYITDGWGDFLLVFETVNGKEIDKKQLVEDIFHLQQMLYEDFMVDRTELIYTPKCLDYVARLKSYDFSISVRLLEDRKLESSVEDFIDSFNSKPNQRDLRKRLPGIEDCSICQTPGRTDLTIRFKLKEDTEPNNFYKEFLNWMGDMGKSSKMSTWYPDSMSLLDKIETTIERHSQR